MDDWLLEFAFDQGQDGEESKIRSGLHKLVQITPLALPNGGYIQFRQLSWYI